jgi:hypothetical protein
MHIIVLGGSNDEKGDLDDFTRKRCDKSIEIIKKNNEKNIILHFSGNVNNKFNKMQNPLSHSILCKKYFRNIIKLFPEKNINLHESNNCTVDEAINFGNYFKNSKSKILIITNDWHYERVNYLFSKVFNFNKINNFKIISVKSNINKIINIIKEEKLKLDQLKNNPYGKWNEWLVNNSLKHFIT